MATFMSEGFVAMQCSLVPRMAWLRLKPRRAEQPVPGSRLLHGIAVSGPKRLAGAFANVPTWKEQGVDSVYANWRGVVGPKGITAAQVAYWDGIFARLAQMPEWREELVRLLQDPVYLNSRETKAYLDSQHQELRAVLVDLGLAK